MKISAIIIAGGKSRRMGLDKTRLQWQGKTLLENAVALAQFFSDDIVISSNTPVATGWPVIPDLIKNAGPLGGLHATLSEIRYQKALVLPVDMPLLNREVISYLWQHIDSKKDLQVFKTPNRLQMLVGIYDKNLLPLIEKQITNKDYKLRNLLQKSAYQLIDGSKFARQFININTPGDWEKLRQKNE